MKKVQFISEENDERFAEVWALLNGDYPDEEQLYEAQKLLGGIKEKDAEWYYVQAAVDYHKRFYGDCRKHLKKAIKLDPENERYHASLGELEETVKREAGATVSPPPHGEEEKEWDCSAEACCQDWCPECCSGACSGC